jgi:hypothetical protein
MGRRKFRKTSIEKAAVEKKSKPEAATAVVVAPDDAHEDSRNMLSCI